MPTITNGLPLLIGAGLFFLGALGAVVLKSRRR